MRFQEGAPGRLVASLRCGLYAVVFEDVRNRTSGNRMTEIRQRTPNSSVSPLRILFRHAHYEVGNLKHHPWPSRSPPSRTVVPLSRDQLSVPSEDGVRRDDTSHFFEELPAKGLPLDCKPSSFVVRQTKSSPTELTLEDAVLLDQVIDDLRLLAVGPAGERGDEELETQDVVAVPSSPQRTPMVA